jgi:hypothetical protein
VSEPLDLPTREGYDLWSQIYDDEDNPLIALETAWITRLLGDVRGLAVADVGCGTERHALAIHQLSDYVIAATRAGFHIDHMSEHVVDEELAARSPRAQKYLGWPLLLCCDCAAPEPAVALEAGATLDPRLRSRRVGRGVRRPRTEVGERRLGDRSVERVERRIQAERLR